MPTIVPNEPPSITLPYRLAIIGDSPSKDDSMTGRLFTGAPGNVLQALLTNHAIIRPGVLMANIINSTPPKTRRKPKEFIKIKGARQNNLKNIVLHLFFRN